MMNKKYSILHLPILSFFSKRLYRDVGHNWKGANLSYLFLLLAICWILPTSNLREDVIQSLDSNQVQLINQLPDIRIKNGRVEIDQEQPYFIKNNGETVAIIDTTGSMNYIDDDSVMALLTEDALIVRRGKNQFNTLELSKVADFHLNKQIANQWIQMTKKSMVALSYGIFLFLSYIFTVLLILLIAVAGSILSAMMRSSLKFSGILRLAAAAATPSIILVTISVTLGRAIPGLVVYIGVTSLYLLAGIISCSKPPEEEKIPKLKLSNLLEEEHNKRSSRAA